MNGGVPRTVWFIWPADPHAISAKSVAGRLAQLGRPAHLVWNPVSGEIVQMLPPMRAAGGLISPDGGTALNREGRVCVQVQVLGAVTHPFTDGPMAGLDAMLGWLDTWGVPRQWPAGPPRAYPHSVGAERNRRLWSRGGHFGHSQVPGTDRPDPGAIDIRRITGTGAPAMSLPELNGDRGDPGGHRDHAAPAARPLEAHSLA